MSEVTESFHPVYISNTEQIHTYHSWMGVYYSQITYYYSYCLTLIVLVICISNVLINKHIFAITMGCTETIIIKLGTLMTYVGVMHVFALVSSIVISFLQHWSSRFLLPLVNSSLTRPNAELHCYFFKSPCHFKFCLCLSQ